MFLGKYVKENLVSDVKQYNEKLNQELLTIKQTLLQNIDNANNKDIIGK